MIIVILAVGILMVICGSILYSKLESDKDDIAAAFQIIGVIVIISSIIAFVSLLKCVLDRVGIDEKIAMYGQEQSLCCTMCQRLMLPLLYTENGNL
mgnify:CR=1 FL=1